MIYIKRLFCVFIWAAIYPISMISIFLLFLFMPFVLIVKFLTTGEFTKHLDKQLDYLEILEEFFIITCGENLTKKILK